MATEAQKILRTLYDAGCTDGEMAEASGIHRVTICKIRNGQLSGDRSLAKLQDMARDLGLQGAGAYPLTPPAQRQKREAAEGPAQRLRREMAAQEIEEAARNEEASGGILSIVGAGAAGALLGFLGGLWYAARAAGGML